MEDFKDKYIALLEENLKESKIKISRLENEIALLRGINYQPMTIPYNQPFWYTTCLSNTNSPGEEKGY